MNTLTDGGGPAFPNDAVSWGMSLRAYFIAHAPVEPWDWFHPQVEPRPECPPFEGDPVWSFNAEEIMQARDWRMECSADPPPWMSAFAEAWKDYWRKNADWQARFHRQRLIQWPAYWADEMIQQLNTKP